MALDNTTTPATTPYRCGIKTLPSRLHVEAAKRAVVVNPVNAPARSAAITEPSRVAILTTKYWGPTARTLTVSFLDRQPPPEIRSKILFHMNSWKCSITFKEVATGGTVRIAMRSGAQGGFWSYLGTDILSIPKNQPTMNLEGFLNAPDSEYDRVVEHETGHTLGFPHEHMRREIVENIDPDAAYAYFGKPPNSWDKATVDAQVLTALDDNDLTETPFADPTSIMCYGLPGEIMRDKKPVPGGLDINESDFAFAHKLYPPVGAQISHVEANGHVHKAEKSAWDESADVSFDEFKKALEAICREE